MHWVIILLVYIFIAARLPVWLVVQSRDYINYHQLFIALGVLTLGVFALAFAGGGEVVAPAVNVAPPVRRPSGRS